MAKADPIVEKFEAEIRAGKYRSGHALPTVAALAKQWKVGDNVAREAYLRLGQLGLVYSRVAKGWFVV